MSLNSDERWELLTTMATVAADRDWGIERGPSGDYAFHYFSSVSPIHDLRHGRPAFLSAEAEDELRRSASPPKQQRYSVYQKLVAVGRGALEFSYNIN